MPRCGVVLLLTIAGCSPAYFVGQTEPDMAECRNLARLVTTGCYNGEGLPTALVCRNQSNNAYDDCMLAKGYLTQEQSDIRKQTSSPLFVTTPPL